MNEYYQNWLTAIKHSSVLDREKSRLIDSVRALSKSGAPVILSVKHFARLLGFDYGMLVRMIKARDKFYRSFTIKKRDGGQRQIEAPYPSLKMVQRWILNVILLPSSVIHPSSTGFIPKLSIVDNARPHLGNPVVLKMDVKDFFPSIPERLVVEYFNSLGYCSNLAEVFAVLCCKNDCLPQGAPTSPLLSNILFYEMDKQLATMAIEEDLAYTRYADDLTFSGRKIPIPVIRYVEMVAESNGLLIKREKTRRVGKTSRKIITGVSISSGKMTIPREDKREIRQKVHYILKYGLINHLKHVQSRDLLAGYRLLGRLSYWHSVEPENQYVIDSLAALKRLLKCG